MTKAKHFTITPGMEVLKKNERKRGRPGMTMLPDWPNKYRVISVADNLVQLETMEGKPLTSKTPYASVKPLLKRSQTDSLSDRAADCSELVEDTHKVTCSRTSNDLTSSKTEQDTLEEDGIVITGIQSGRTLPAALSERVEDFRAMLLSPHTWLDDRAIDHAQALLKAQYHNIGGLHATTSLALQSTVPSATQGFANHWVTGFLTPFPGSVESPPMTSGHAMEVDIHCLCRRAIR
ncbi:uncharacterized protein LOC121700714 [Alosa sapidissima]|uniref:uncharacterized protein LOC121700714 n=1 Tax=Alosa sapidissima TaxID=34773 RepID=UPI001C09CC4E|nr:uncharacterized protein LOC121700714 [Alosa sapidissima]